MHKNQYFNKYRLQQIEQQELERKWRVFNEEQEMSMMRFINFSNGNDGGGALDPNIEFTFKSDSTELYIYPENYNGVSIIDWGDGMVEEFIDGDEAMHTYDKGNNDLITIKISIPPGSSLDLGGEITEITFDKLYNLESLDLGGNQLTSFDSILPSGLVSLRLTSNQLTSFNSILPSGLVSLFLNENQLTSFDSVLPSGLVILSLYNNRLTSFDSVPPSGIYSLDLANNQLNTAEVNSTLILLDSSPLTGSFAVFTLEMDPIAPPSGAGLTAKTNLQAKGFAVYTD